MEVYAREMDAFNDEACPFSTGGGTRRVRLVREAGGRGGGFNGERRIRSTATTRTPHNEAKSDCAWHLGVLDEVAQQRERGDGRGEHDLAQLRRQAHLAGFVSS